MARQNITMTPDEVATFLAAGSVLQVGTVGADGFPHVAPMWYVTQDDRVVFRSFTKSQKILNLHRNPSLTVLVEDGTKYSELRGVMIKARARLIADRDYVLSIYGALVEKYPMIDDTPRPIDPGALEAAFGRHADKNTAVIVEPVHTISWDHRKIGGAY